MDENDQQSDRLATSGGIPESLDEAARLWRRDENRLTNYRRLAARPPKLLGEGAVSGEPDSLATSGCIPESLDEAVSLAKSLGLMDSIRSEKDPARAVEMTVDYFRLRGFLPTTPCSHTNKETPLFDGL